MTTLTIMRYLPREVDPLVYNMSHEDPGDVTYSEIGGLGEQISFVNLEKSFVNLEKSFVNLRKSFVNLRKSLFATFVNLGEILIWYFHSGEQIRELREVIELPLLNPELFMRVGITPPKGFRFYHFHFLV